MWGFAVHPPRMIEAAPKHDEFFASDVRDSAHALIRELTQNSGDAALESTGEVRMSFRFLAVDSGVFAERYLRGLPDRPTLKEHLAASGLRSPLPLDEDGPVPVLVIEDFGTTGLTGNFDASNQEKSAFLAFWKRYGTSSKGDDAGGRHGIGKSVVPSSSRIRAFFGVTRRSDDQRELMMGQVVLRPHRIDEGTYDSFGQFSPSGDDEWALPYQEETVAQAKADFQLEREAESGLSLIVPYPLHEITQDALVQAAVEHCFHQVLSGHLRLEINDVVLARDTLLTVMADRADPRLRAAAELSAEVAKGSLKAFDTKEGALRARLSTEHFHEDDLTAMRECYRKGETVAVRLPVEIRPKDGDFQIGAVFLYVRRATDVNGARETYVRGRVTVPGQGRSLIGSSTLGLLVTDHGPASRFLGDSEGVSHVRWVMNKLRDKYRAVEQSFHPIRHGLGDLQKILADEAEDRHIKDALKQFFWQPKPPEERPEEAAVTDDRPDIEGRPAALEVRRIAGGFEISVDPTVAVEPVHARIEVGYAVRNGVPKWSPADFEFGKSVTVVQTGLGQVSFEGNVIRIHEAEAGFNMQLKGFDPNRDLLVRALAVDLEA